MDGLGAVRWRKRWTILAASRVLIDGAAELAEHHLDIGLHLVQAQHHIHDLTDGIGRMEALIFHFSLQRLYDVPPPKPPTSRQSPPQASGSTHAFPATLSSPSRQSYSHQNYASGSSAT
jgi:hypothetical protein